APGATSGSIGRKSCVGVMRHNQPPWLLGGISDASAETEDFSVLAHCCAVNAFHELCSVGRVVAAVVPEPGGHPAAVLGSPVIGPGVVAFLYDPDPAGAAPDRSVAAPQAFAPPTHTGAGDYPRLLPVRHDAAPVCTGLRQQPLCSQLCAGVCATGILVFLDAAAVVHPAVYAADPAGGQRRFRPPGASGRRLRPQQLGTGVHASRPPGATSGPPVL